MTDQPTPQRRAPLEVPMVPFVVAGIAAWVLAGAVLLVARTWLAVPDWWLWTCLTGAVLGLVGWVVVRRHDRHAGGRSTTGR